MTTVTYEITGMHCDGCAARLKKLLERADGVSSAEASFAEKSSSVDFDPAKISESEIIEIIRKAGFDIAG